MPAFVRYLLPALVTLAIGFVAGLLLAPRPQLPVAAEPASSMMPRPVRTPGSQAMREGASTAGLERPDLDAVAAGATVFDQLYLLHQFAAGQGTNDLLPALDRLASDPDPLYNANGIYILLERLTAIDPRAALSWVEGQPNRNDLISHILTSWARNDPEPALDYFLAIDNQQLQYAVGARLLEDPTLRQSGLLAEVRTALGAYAERVEEDIRRQRISPAEAFEEALVTTDRRRNEFLMRAVNRWYQADPDAALDRIIQIDNAATRQQMLQVVLALEGRQDPQNALQLIETYAADNVGLRRQALMNLANQDPLAAIAPIERFGRETGSQDLLGHLVAQWIRVDEGAALAYLDTIDASARTQVMQRLAYEYVRSDPERGMAWAMSLPAEYNQSVKQAALSTLHQHPALAESWLRRLQDQPELQQVLVQQVAARRAQQDPQAAWDWLDGYRESPGYNQARRMVLGNWLNQDPEAASRLLDPAATNRGEEHLYRAAASAWMRKDEEAAMGWVANLPSGPSRDEALTGLLPFATDLDEVVALLEDDDNTVPRQVHMHLAYRLLRDQVPVEDIITRVKLSDRQADLLRRQARGDTSGASTTSAAVF